MHAAQKSADTNNTESVFNNFSTQPLHKPLLRSKKTSLRITHHKMAQVYFLFPSFF